MNVKKSETKAELIGRLLTNWEISSTGELSFQQSPGRVSDIEKAKTLLRNSVSSDGWNKSLAFISTCLLYTSPSPRDRQKSRMPSSA